MASELFFSCEQLWSARGKILHFATVMDTNRDLIFLAYREQSLLILLSVFRVGFYAQFHQLCYKKNWFMLLAVYYRVMEHLGSLESTQEARVALGYRFRQLLRFFRALQTSRVLHNSIVHTKA